MDICELTDEDVLFLDLHTDKLEIPSAMDTAFLSLMERRVYSLFLNQGLLTLLYCFGLLFLTPSTRLRHNIHCTPRLPTSALTLRLQRSNQGTPHEHRHLLLFLRISAYVDSSIFSRSSLDGAPLVCPLAVFQ